MRALLCFTLFFLTAACFVSCEKDDTGKGEDKISGTWIKGSNTGDTLRFVSKDGKNLLSYNLSFNPAMYSPTEVEYIYTNNKPAIKNFMAPPGGFFTIQSFEWVQPGQEFKVKGIDLFQFMSSTNVYFTYHKIP